jgi:hypothetical protein
MKSDPGGYLFFEVGIGLKPGSYLLIIEVYLWIRKDKRAALLLDIVIEVILFLGSLDEKEKNSPAGFFDHSYNSLNPLPG